MRRDVVIIGASVGGSTPILEITRRLPADFPAAVLIVRHVGTQESVLPELINLKSAMKASHAVDGERVRHGHIYVAPPDWHLLMDGERLLLSAGPKENYARPAINPLFRSAAIAYGVRVIGIILSGTLDDGTAGLKAVKQRGGITIIQSPEDAQYPSMPLSARSAVDVDYCLRSVEIAPRLLELVRDEVSVRDTAAPNEKLEAEVAMDRAGGANIDLMNRIGSRSAFSCPECGGTLWKMHDESLDRYRCHTGHAFSSATSMAMLLAILLTAMTQQRLYSRQNDPRRSRLR